MKQDSILVQCFFIDYPFYYNKQSYYICIRDFGFIFISNPKFIDLSIKAV